MKSFTGISEAAVASEMGILHRSAEWVNEEDLISGLIYRFDVSREEALKALHNAEHGHGIKRVDNWLHTIGSDT